VKIKLNFEKSFIKNKHIQTIIEGGRIKNKIIIKVVVMHIFLSNFYPISWKW